MKIALYLRTYALFVVLMSVCLPLNSQSFNPEIENYSIKDYNADNQNWGIDVDSDGVVYVANNKGLLMYTGEVWKLFELPNNTIVRSVLVDQNRIYTGSYEEFGFWTKNNYGGIKYTSLVNKFDASHDFTNEQFWQITSYKEKIFFKSISGGIYVYDGDAIKYIENSVDTFDMVVYQNKLIIGNRSRGLLQVHNDKLIPYRGREDVLPKLDSINNVASVGEQLFFFDLKNGGFLYNSTLKKAKSLPKKINLFLYKSILNKATFLDEDTLIFGTIKEGLILYNIKLNTLKQINNISGLNNNTVLDLKFKQGLLWVALDNGLSKINFKSPFLFYKDDTGILGRVYDVVFFKNKYYLASNTGVYMLSKTRELKLIDNTEGHVWSLDIINNQLFVNHNEGSFVINSDTISEKIHSDGVYRMIKVPKKKNQYLQSTYTGIRLVRKNEKSWYSVSVKNISFLVNKIVFESDSVIWASHPYKGVFRIQLNKNYTEALKIKAYEKIQNHNLYQTKICKINDTILFYNSGLWFTYLKNKDSIVSYERFQKFNNKALISYGDKGGWLIDKENRITYFDENYLEINQIDMSEVKRRSVSGFEKIKAQNDSLRIINLNDGFALFTMNEIEEKDNKEVKTPIINRIYSKNKEFSINEFKLRIPYKDAQYLSFEISTPYLYGGGKYSYNLYGKINQNELFNKGKLTLQNLAYGDYVLAIKNNSIKEKISKIKEFHFTVLPPWYLSLLMKFIYVLLLLLVFYLIYIFNKNKMKKKQIALERKYISETQNRINKIEKENLKKEIESKRKELLNTTDAAIRKNESIMILRNELKRFVEISPKKSVKTKKILEIAEKNIFNNRDWEIFESNFNELNQDFFKKLTDIQPKLTKKDLRLCAYVKTGLTSKKIAPLMGISVRGVELHRYRLGKKLNITIEETLAKFLLKF